MKRKHLLIFVLILALIVTSCANENSKEKTENSENDGTTIECPRCRAKISKDSNYCSTCGEKIEKEHTEKKVEKTDDPKDEDAKEDPKKDPEEDKKDDNKEDNKKDEPKDEVKEEVKPKVSGYDARKAALEAEKYVTLYDVNKLKIEGKKEFILVDSYKPDKYTGIKKKWYSSDLDQYRVPFIREDSDYVKKLNKEIQDYVKNSPPEYDSVDYDAYVYDGILSVVIRYDFTKDNVVKAYNFDISSGKIEKISTQKLIEKIGLKKDRIEYSIKVHMNMYLDHHIVKYPNRRRRIEKKRAEAKKYVLDNFNKMYENNSLLIYKTKTNKNFELQLPYDKTIMYLPGDFRILTLGQNSLQMAMLSRPLDAIGLICTSTKMKFPEQDRYGRDIKIHKLNDKSNGQPIYIIPFSEENNYVSIADVKFYTTSKAKDKDFYPKRISNNKYKFPKTENADIYLYHTLLPEGMPSEAISMDTGLEGTSTQKPISYNGKNDYGFEYLYGSGSLSEFSYGHDGSLKIEFNEGREFKTSGNWKSIGVPITKGAYTNDSKYLYLFPSKADKENGADYYYILKIIRADKYEFVYKSKTGIMKLEKQLWKVSDNKR